MQEGYPPDAAGFVLPMLRPGMRVLDIGCGHGSVTLGLGTAAHPIRVLGVDSAVEQVELARAATRRRAVSTVEFVVGAAERLPVPSGSVDVVFAHALFEHVRSPQAVLAEAARVLRKDGTLAVSTSDWSRARIRPKTANVDAALRGHYLLWQRAGGNPFAGRQLPEHVRQAGFGDVRVRTRYRPDRDYRELAAGVEERLAAALAEPAGDHAQLASAARSAWVWARGGGGEFSQCWVEVVATR